MKSHTADRLSVDSLAVAAESESVNVELKSVGDKVILIELSWTAPSQRGEVRSSVSITGTLPKPWRREIPISMVVHDFEEPKP